MNIHIPADVPPSMKQVYEDNYRLVTHDTGRLMLFAGDQKIEHLNADFHGEGIAEEDNDPIHLFNIASKANIGVFAAQLGLIAHYGEDFPKIPYLIKLNSKTNLVGTSQHDPISTALNTVDQVVEFRNHSNLNIVGVGYTIYIGSEFENEMLKQAARIIFNAHQHGLLAVIWCYPRGKAVPDEKDPDLIAGAAGVAASIGADFVKINAPKKEGVNGAELLKDVVQAAGRTQVVCAGGSTTDVEKFLKNLHDQIHIGGIAGSATGRNIHQKPLDEAVRFCNAIYAITVENKTVEDAMRIFNG